MSEFQYAVAMIVPEPYREAIEALGQQMGHSGHEYTIPLSVNGESPVTHWGLNTISTQSFVDVLGGQVPPGMEAQAFHQVVSNIAISVRPVQDYAGHFADLAAAQGLMRVNLGLQDPGT